MCDETWYLRKCRQHSAGIYYIWLTHKSCAYGHISVESHRLGLWNLKHGISRLYAFWECGVGHVTFVIRSHDTCSKLKKCRYRQKTPNFRNLCLSGQRGGSAQSEKGAKFHQTPSFVPLNAKKSSNKALIGQNHDHMTCVTKHGTFGSVANILLEFTTFD